MTLLWPDSETMMGEFCDPSDPKADQVCERDEIHTETKQKIAETAFDLLYLCALKNYPICEYIFFEFLPQL